MRTRRHRALRERQLRIVDRILQAVIEVPLSKDSVSSAFLIPLVVTLIRIVLLTDSLLIVVTGGKLQVNRILELEEPLEELYRQC